MRATLVYNPGSGGAASEDELFEQLEGIGWEVDRCLPKQQLDDGLCHGADVVVVAGGDTSTRVLISSKGRSAPTLPPERSRSSPRGNRRYLAARGYLAARR